MPDGGAGFALMLLLPPPSAVAVGNGTPGAQDGPGPRWAQYRDRQHQWRAGARSHVSPRASGQCRHAVPLRSATADHYVDAEHDPAARHDLHRHRRQRASHREPHRAVLTDIISSEGTVQGVEVNAGTAAKIGLKAGDEVVLPVCSRRRKPNLRPPVTPLACPPCELCAEA